MHCIRASRRILARYYRCFHRAGARSSCLRTPSYLHVAVATAVAFVTAKRRPPARRSRPCLHAVTRRICSVAGSIWGRLNRVTSSAASSACHHRSRIAARLCCPHIQVIITHQVIPFSFHSHFHFIPGHTIIYQYHIRNTEPTTAYLIISPPKMEHE
jgi:hypothetical protein